MKGKEGASADKGWYIRRELGKIQQEEDQWYIWKGVGYSRRDEGDTTTGSAGG